MPVQNGIFYESQRGGLCRLHSINGYFGESKISTELFNQYSQKLDKYIKDKFHEESHCLKFDSVSSDHNILVTFILKHYGVYPRYLHINSVYCKPEEIKKHMGDLKGDYIFIYNAGHIWGARRKDGQWWKVDSLSGVHKFNINTLSNMRDTGFLIPVVPKQEFFRNVEKIHKILKRDIPEIDPTDRKDAIEKISAYLKKISETHHILGDLEIPLGVAMDVLDVVYGKVGDYKEDGPETDFKENEFAPIENIIKNYDEFLYKFTPRKYHDFELKNKYLPEILLTLLKLKINYDE